MYLTFWKSITTLRACTSSTSATSCCNIVSAVFSSWICLATKEITTTPCSRRLVRSWPCRSDMVWPWTKEKCESRNREVSLTAFRPEDKSEMGLAVHQPSIERLPFGVRWRDTALDSWIFGSRKHPHIKSGVAPPHSKSQFAWNWRTGAGLPDATAGGTISSFHAGTPAILVIGPPCKLISQFQLLASERARPSMPYV